MNFYMILHSHKLYLKELHVLQVKQRFYFSKNLIRFEKFESYHSVLVCTAVYSIRKKKLLVYETKFYEYSAFSDTIKPFSFSVRFQGPYIYIHTYTFFRYLYCVHTILHFISSTDKAVKIPFFYGKKKNTAL